MLWYLILCVDHDTQICGQTLFSILKMRLTFKWVDWIKLIPSIMWVGLIWSVEAINGKVTNPTAPRRVNSASRTLSLYLNYRRILPWVFGLLVYPSYFVLADPTIAWVSSLKSIYLSVSFSPTSLSHCN